MREKLLPIFIELCNDFSKEIEIIGHTVIILFNICFDENKIKESFT